MFETSCKKLADWIKFSPETIHCSFCSFPRKPENEKAFLIILLLKPTKVKRELKNDERQ